MDAHPSFSCFGRLPLYVPLISRHRKKIIPEASSNRRDSLPRPTTTSWDLSSMKTFPSLYELLPSPRLSGTFPHPSTIGLAIQQITDRKNIDNDFLGNSVYIEASGRPSFSTWPLNERTGACLFPGGLGILLSYGRGRYFLPPASLFFLAAIHHRR